MAYEYPRPASSATRALIEPTDAVPKLNRTSTNYLDAVTSQQQAATDAADEQTRKNHEIAQAAQAHSLPTHVQRQRVDSRSSDSHSKPDTAVDVDTDVDVDAGVAPGFLNRQKSYSMADQKRAVMQPMLQDGKAGGGYTSSTTDA